jgi:hypothetical protein
LITATAASAMVTVASRAKIKYSLVAMEKRGSFTFGSLPLKNPVMRRRLQGNS